MKRITLKLLTYTLFLFILLLIFNFILQSSIITKGFEKNLKNRIINFANSLSEKYINSLDYSKEASNIADTLAGRVSVYDVNQSLIYTAGKYMFGKTRNIERSAISSVLSGKTIYQTDQKTFRGSLLVTFGMPIKKGDKILGAVFIHAPLKDVQNDIQSVINQTILLFITSILLSTIGALILSSLVTKPILKITQAAKKIADGNYNVKIDIKNKDEIGELATTINTMAQNLLKTEKLRKDFIANTTHELRTPLSIIKSYAEAISDGILNQDEVKDYALSIINESDYLNSLINQILELSKLQSGTQKLNIQKVDLKNLFEQIISEISIIKGKRNIELVSDATDIMADPILLKRCFTNILVNSISHTNETGNILIKSEVKDDYVNICIKDDGEGIAEEDLPYIFNRFYSKNAKKGIGGLGLAIAKEIVFLHGGEIMVNSKKGEGAEFVITLKKHL